MNSKAWSLEIVRGRETGRVYALQAGETTLGNALNGSRGIDLAMHEGEGPRRMSARHAALDCSTNGLILRDLDSPGGTFVNRQRILSGQAKSLQAGDLIQLGGVQLKVVGRAPESSKPRPQPVAKQVTAPAPSPPASSHSGASSVLSPVALPSPFVLASGGTCRTWDDFLTISAQRWTALREELTSGRIDAFLRSIHRPIPQASGTPDEQLDRWLSSLPTTRPAVPELEVHPEKVVVRAAAGGGIVRQSIKLTNTGYRLLRSKIGIEDRDAAWIKFDPRDIQANSVTVDQSELAFEVEIPETLDAPRVGSFVVESNGGNRRVEVRVERPATPSIPEFGPEEPATTGTTLGEIVANQPTPLRLLLGAISGFVARMLVLLGGLLSGAGASEASPPLLGPAILFGCLGGVAAGFLSFRRGARRDLATSSFAGACVGIFTAAVTVAACRALEPLLGTQLSTSPVAQVFLWAVLGGGLAALSSLLIPPPRDVKASP